jgi:hypothetical protein
MRIRTLVIVLILAAVFVTATLTLGGDGHRRLAKMLPSLHGGR